MGDRVYTGMTPADALKMMVYPSMGRTTKSVEYWAGRAGIAVSTLYAYCNGDREITVNFAKLITNLTGDSQLIESICLDTDHIAISTRQAELPSDTPLFEQIGETVRRGSELVQGICDAVKDHVVTTEERADINEKLVNHAVQISTLRTLVWQLPTKPVNVQRLKGVM